MTEIDKQIIVKKIEKYMALSRNTFRLAWSGIERCTFAWESERLPFRHRCLETRETFAEFIITRAAFYVHGRRKRRLGANDVALQKKSGLM